MGYRMNGADGQLVDAWPHEVGEAWDLNDENEPAHKEGKHPRNRKEEVERPWRRNQVFIERWKQGDKGKRLVWERQAKVCWYRSFRSWWQVWVLASQWWGTTGKNETRKCWGLIKRSLGLRCVLKEQKWRRPLERSLGLDDWNVHTYTLICLA